MLFRNNYLKIIAVAVFAVALTGSFAAAQDTIPKITGYTKVKFDYTPSDQGDTSEFNASVVRFKLAGKINEKTDYGVFIDAVRDDVLLDAYFNHKITSDLSVKGGQFKTPYGTDNLRSLAKMAFINRPYMKKETSPAFRDKGLQVTYKISKFDLQAAVMNGSGQNKGETNNNKSTSFRAVAHVLPQLQVSGNFSTGRNSTTYNDRDEFINFGASGETGPWEYSGEFAQKSHGDFTGNAYYAYVAYNYETAFGYVPMITPALRYDSSDPDTDIDDNAKSRITLGVTTHFGKRYADRLMINYELADAETGDPDDTFLMEYQIKY
jgi:hypothetical protein